MAEKCGAKTRAGGTCKRNTAFGTPRCDMHGGKSPQAIAAAARRKAEAAAMEAVKTYGLPIDVSPTEALLDEVRWTAGHVHWLRMQVQALEAEALAWGKTEEVEKSATEFAGVDITHKATPHVWLDLYHRERVQLLKVCATAIQCGIEERRVRVAEQYGAQIASVIKAIFDELGLTPEQAARVPEIVPRHLRAVAA